MKDKKPHPKGSKVQNWTLFQEPQKGKIKPVIRRWVTLPDGTKINERYPAKGLANFIGKPGELEKLVIRLNGEVSEDLKRKQKFEIRHAYIDPLMLEKYLDFLKSRIPNEGNVTREYRYLTKYFLDFFINKLQLASPLEWHLNQDKWCWALLNQFPSTKVRESELYRIWPTAVYLPSDTTVRMIVQGANRFMAWLHQRRPVEAHPLVFSPVSKAVFKKYEADRERLNLVEQGEFIPDSDWEVIKKNLPSELRPFAMLAYNYGFRRSEVLGVQLENVMESYYHCTQQLDGIQKGLIHEGSPIGKPRYRSLKGRKARKINHWFSTPEDCYDWIETIFNKMLLVHQDTFSDRWAIFIKSLDMTYDFHDLRHTFITKAVMKYPHSDVMLCAGHENIETTMGYFHDGRQLSELRFIPGRKKTA
jgi:integrase